jgi:hypothetical protein
VKPTRVWGWKTGAALGAAGALTVNNTHTVEKHTLKRIFLAEVRDIVNLLFRRAAVINYGGDQTSEAR